MKTLLELLKIKNLLLLLVKFYQVYLSPLKLSKCPFQPTCSSYMYSSLKEYGVLKGLVLGVWRILRCNPFNKGYYDPPVYWGSKLQFKPIKKQESLNG